MNYLFPVSLQEMQGSGVECCEFPGGVMLARDSLEKSIAHLISKGINMPRNPTPRPSMYESVYVIDIPGREEIPGPEGYNVTFEPRPVPSFPEGQSIVHSWHGNEAGRESVRKIALSILRKVTDRKIVITAENGKGHEVWDADCFFIHLFSTPRVDDDSPVGIDDYRIVPSAVPSTVFGYRISSKTAFPDPGIGLSIKATGEFPVASLVNNSLFILLDLNKWSEDDLMVFRRIIESVALAFANEDDKATLTARFQRYYEAKERRKFVAMIRRIGSARAEAIRKEVTTLEKRAAEQQLQFTNTLRNLTQSKKELAVLESHGRDADMFLKQFRNISSFKKVRGLRMDGPAVIVTTECLFCTDPRTKKIHKIGEFDISFNTETMDLRFNNLTHKVRAYDNGMNAPHVFPDGHMCMGSASEYFPELMSKFDFQSVFDLAIQFVESVNTGDNAGRHVDKWPIATPEELKAAGISTN